MIIYGWKTTPISSQKLEAACRWCNEETLYFMVIRRTLHIFWIPIIPLRKKRFTICTSCNETFGTGFISKRWSNLHPDTRSTIGIVLFVALCAILGCKYVYDQRAITNFKNSPYSGQYFVFKHDHETCKKNPYMFARTEGIKGDTVIVRLDSYGYQEERGAKDRAEKQCRSPRFSWDSRRYELSKAEFKELEIQSLIS